MTSKGRVSMLKKQRPDEVEKPLEKKKWLEVVEG
jgi:hypothetical protein